MLLLGFDIAGVFLVLLLCFLISCCLFGLLMCRAVGTVNRLRLLLTDQRVGDLSPSPAKLPCLGPWKWGKKIVGEDVFCTYGQLDSLLEQCEHLCISVTNVCVCVSGCLGASLVWVF